MNVPCAGAVALVEKLADGEASRSERQAAEAHLSACPDCRDHLEFLTALHARTRELTHPEPPLEYWERLPRRVQERIAAQEKPASGRIHRVLTALLAPGALRFSAIGAVALLLAAIGITVHREGALRPEPAAAPEAPAAASSRDDARNVAPPMAHDEPAEPPLPAAEAPSAPRPTPTPPPPEAVPDPQGPAPREARPMREAAPEQPMAPPDVVEERASFRSRAASPTSAERASASPDREATPPAPGAEESCASLREALAVSEPPGSADLGYRLALCSLREHEVRPDGETLEAALADGERFLAVEPEGPRAAEIREKLERIRIR